MWRPELIAAPDDEANSGAALDRKAREQQPPAESFEFPVYLAGLGGTVLAGGFFPVVIFAIVLVASILAGEFASIEEIGGVMMALFFGFFLGCILALAAAVCIFPLVGVLDWVASLQQWRRLLVSCAGGWCGFASVAALTGQQSEGMVYVFEFGAMALGQLGAALMIRRLCEREPRPLEAAPTNSSQLPLRQLFGITTAVALATAVITSLPIAPQTLRAMGFAAACQAFIAACYVIAGRSTNARASHPIADVSRETTAATPLA